jgi:hypothetical protein
VERIIHATISRRLLGFTKTTLNGRLITARRLLPITLHLLLPATKELLIQQQCNNKYILIHAGVKPELPSVNQKELDQYAMNQQCDLPEAV